MKILLDTHLLLWAAYSPEKIPPQILKELEEQSNELIFSAASIWEIAIKSSLRKDVFDVDPIFFRKNLLLHDYKELAITGAHASLTNELPQIHKDPFDRILIAQAKAEALPLFTSDKTLTEYGNPVHFFK